MLAHGSMGEPVDAHVVLKSYVLLGVFRDCSLLNQLRLGRHSS